VAGQRRRLSRRGPGGLTSRGRRRAAELAAFQQSLAVLFQNQSTGAHPAYLFRAHPVVFARTVGAIQRPGPQGGRPKPHPALFARIVGAIPTPRATGRPAQAHPALFARIVGASRYPGREGSFGLTSDLLCSRQLLVPSEQGAVPDIANTDREHSRYSPSGPTRWGVSGIPPRGRPRYIREASPRSERATRFFHICNSRRAGRVPDPRPPPRR
jgi:hypothetical protein